MYDAGGSYSVCRPSTQDFHIAQRLSRLGQDLDPAARRRRLALEKEELRVLSMRRPLTTEQAYRLFGAFLGLLPPFAFFNRTILSLDDAWPSWAILFVTMNVICGLVGRWYGGVLGRWYGRPGTHERVGFVAAVLGMALAWSLVTGGLGGALFFGFGAAVGFVCALPVALVAFPVFAILHRLISRGGMIDERHTWPLAFGIPLTIAAMISSPWIK
jgi:hypothetical protein